MTVDPNETMLIIDWDESDADIKLAVLANPATADRGYALSVKGWDHKKQSELYVPPAARLGGQVVVTRIFELDDMPYGSSLADVEIWRFQLTNQRSFNIQGICRIMG